MIRKLGFALLACLLASSAHAQAPGDSNPYHLLSTASTNPTLVHRGNSVLNSLQVISTTTTIYYLKFYDVTAAPSCGVDTVVLSYPIPYGASNAGGGFVVPAPVGYKFSKGIGLCITGGAADNDTTVAATGVFVNLGYR